jgi:AcrR family transcriptional regulator
VRSTKGQPKGDKRARTRAALIAAASELIAESGYDRLSLERVAIRAGMTRGAIYGNFKNKEDLILAVVLARWKPHRPALRTGAPLKEQLRAIGQAVANAARGRPDAAVRALSFQLYALTHDDMRRRVASENRDVYREVERWLLQYVAPGELPMRPDRFVRVLHALSDGLLTLHGLTPDLVDADVIVQAFEALAPAPA